MKHTALVAAITVVAVGCQDDKGQAYVEAIELAQNDVTEINIDTNADAVRAPLENSQWLAVAKDSAGEELDYTDQVRWTSDNTDVATVNSSGKITALAVGTVNISLSLGQFTDSESYVVSDAEITGITLSPASLSLDECTSENVTSSGTYADGTTRDISHLSQLSWSTADAAIATTNSNSNSEDGIRVLAHDAGATTLTASFGAASTELSVTANDTLASIEIAPESLALEINNSGTLSAQGSFSDGSSANISEAATWSLNNASDSSFVSVGSSSVSGVTVSGTSVGSATVMADCGGISASSGAVVTVTETPTVISLSFSDAPNGKFYVEAGESEESNKQLTLMAEFTDGSSSDVTSSAEWEVLTGDSDDISVSNSLGSKGELEVADSTDTNKSVIIRATYEDKQSQIEVILLP